MFFLFKKILSRLLVLLLLSSSVNTLYAQKAENMVLNGDLENLSDTIFYYDSNSGTYKHFQSYLLGIKLNTSIINDSLNHSRFGLYLISKDERLYSLGLGKIPEINSQSSIWDTLLNDFPTKRVETKAIKIFTGRFAYSTFIGQPPNTYSSWGSAMLSFPIKENIVINDKLYVEWMDLRFKIFNKSKYGSYGSSGFFCDSIPDSIQIGLSIRKDSVASIIYTNLASMFRWGKHGFIFNSPINARYISIGNKGDINSVTGFIPCPSCSAAPWTVGNILTSANYIDNLRLFRVSGTSSRDTVMCGPGSFVLPGAVGKEWEWNDSITTQNITLNLGDSGWYVCKTFTDGFVRFDSIYVRFDEALSTQPAVDTVGCTGQVLVLPSPRVGGYSYVWSNNSTTQNIVTTAAGSFWVESKKGSCTVVDTFHVVFAPRPVVYLGADTAFCGSFVHLLQAGAGKKDYTWNTGDKSSTLLVNSAGQYSVTVSDSLNCPNADTIHLEQITLNDIQLTEDTLTCKYVTLTGTPLQNNVAYVWSNGATGISTQVIQTGTYTLTASHPFCSLSKSVQVTQLPIPPQVNLGSDTTLCGYGRVVLENKNAGLPNYVYQWSNGSSAPRITVHDSGLYYLLVYRNQCSGSDSVLVAPDCEGTFYIPSAFSPNGDNLNDVFGVTGSNIISVHLRIYNRWGEELYNRKGSAESVFWNGLYKNETCIAGEYIYTVTVEVLHFDKRLQHKSGALHLIR